MHPSNTVLGYLPELLNPAPLRCAVGKGTPNSVVKVLHAHKTSSCVDQVCDVAMRGPRIRVTRLGEVRMPFQTQPKRAAEQPRL